MFRRSRISSVRTKVAVANGFFAGHHNIGKSNVYKNTLSSPEEKCFVMAQAKRVTARNVKIGGKRKPTYRYSLAYEQ